MKAIIAWIVLVATTIWKEVKIGYKTAKNFVVQALSVFKAPPVMNAGGTVVASNKVSSKRVWSAVLMVVGIRQLFIADHFGALVALAAGAILLLIAAITRT